MSKSILAIGGLGAGACLLLSWMMQFALGAHQERKKPVLADLLEVELEGRLVGPVRVTEMRDEGQKLLLVRLSVRAGLPKPPIAASVGAIAWNHVLAAGQAPTEVVVEVGDDARGPVAVVSVPRPARRP